MLYNEWIPKPMKYWRKPLDLDQTALSQGRVVIIAERCKGCSFCIAYCPREVLRLSSDYNDKGYHPPEIIDTSKCVNCHFCEVLCPEFAIYSVEDDGEMVGKKVKEHHRGR
jgi:2-oxoglutarate ferredoxin oxidoreductase subunit delta